MYDPCDSAETVPSGAYDDRRDGFGSGDCAVLSPDYRLCRGEREALYLQGASIAVELNETASEILQRCQSPCAVEDIVTHLLALYVGASPAEIERSVREFLGAALGKGWVRRLPAVGGQPPTA